MEIMSVWATRSDKVLGRYFSTQGREFEGETSGVVILGGKLEDRGGGGRGGDVLVLVGGITYNYCCNCVRSFRMMEAGAWSEGKTPVYDLLSNLQHKTSIYGCTVAVDCVL